jgi:hypothetical protein
MTSVCPRPGSLEQILCRFSGTPQSGVERRQMELFQQLALRNFHP